MVNTVKLEYTKNGMIMSFDNKSRDVITLEETDLTGVDYIVNIKNTHGHRTFYIDNAGATKIYDEYGSVTGQYIFYSDIAYCHMIREQYLQLKNTVNVKVEEPTNIINLYEYKKK